MLVRRPLNISAVIYSVTFLELVATERNEEPVTEKFLERRRCNGQITFRTGSFANWESGVYANSTGESQRDCAIKCYGVLEFCRMVKYDAQRKLCFYNYNYQICDDSANSDGRSTSQRSASNAETGDIVYCVRCSAGDTKVEQNQDPPPETAIKRPTEVESPENQSLRYPPPLTPSDKSNERPKPVLSLSSATSWPVLWVTSPTTPRTDFVISKVVISPTTTIATPLPTRVPTNPDRNFISVPSGRTAKQNVIAEIKIGNTSRQSNKDFDTAPNFGFPLPPIHEFGPEVTPTTARARVRKSKRASIVDNIYRKLEKRAVLQNMPFLEDANVNSHQLPHKDTQPRVAQEAPTRREARPGPVRVHIRSDDLVPWDSDETRLDQPKSTNDRVQSHVINGKNSIIGNAKFQLLDIPEGDMAKIVNVSTSAPKRKIFSRPQSHRAESKLPVENVRGERNDATNYAVQ